MIVTIVSFVVVLGILVFFHELGHYWVARRNGIIVEEFGMGYPPRLVKLFTYDGTDFTLNLIPFGGFARMKGEDAADMAPGSFNAASRGGRAATLIAGPFMNAALAIVLFAASFMAGFPSVVAYPQITEVQPDSIAAQLGLQEGDILLRIGEESAQTSAIPNFQFNVVAPESDESGPVNTLLISRDEEILTISTDGVNAGANVEHASVIDAISYVPALATQIIATAEKSPADLAGLQSGDLIYSVNDSVITLDNPLNMVIQRHLDESVTVRLLRGEEWVDTELTPRSAPPEGEGAMGVQIGAVTRLATMPLGQALWEGVRSTGEYVMLVLQLPVMLILGQLSPSEAQLTGPIGIAGLIGDAVNATIDTGLWFPIWRLSAVISAALAITNLLPLPALDGGRLLFILIEVLRGRRISPEREGFIHMVGFMVLLGLLVMVTFRDIITPQTGIDWHILLGQ